MEFSPPIKWRNPRWPMRYSLEMSIVGIHEKDRPWYLIDHSVKRDGDRADNIGRSDWADWSQSGDLLFAMNGCIYRVPCQQGVLVALEDAIKIADFSNLRFEPTQSPPEFRRWPPPKTLAIFPRKIGGVVALHTGFWA